MTTHTELAEADEADTEPEDDTDRDQSGYTDESASFIKVVLYLSDSVHLLYLMVH